MKVCHSADWSFHYLNMKLSGFLNKGVFASRNARVIFVTVLAVGNILTMASLSLAWFLQYSSSTSQMTTFSGDMDVSIQKVSAYKYVYPYNRNSAEFIDYDHDGVVKSYVVEDASIEDPSNPSNNVTFPLGLTGYSTYATSASDETISSTKIHFEESQNFKYYLIGDEIFNGISDNPWSTLKATAFASGEDPEESDVPDDDKSVVLTDVVVSKGAEFIFFDIDNVNRAQTKCAYFTYDSENAVLDDENKQSRFVVTNNGTLKCLMSGIYKFRYRYDDSSNPFLDIILTSGSQDSIIGLNMIDPTKITIDYRGGTIDKTTYPTLDDYLPDAIQAQNTMVVLDIELTYQNKNDIDAGLKIIRKPQNQHAHPIYGFDGKYNTTDSYTYTGYINDGERNPLEASDFYAFHGVIAKPENVYASPTAAWQALHANTTDYEEDAINHIKGYHKFQNDDYYDVEVPCTLYGKTNNDTVLVPGSSTDSVYHIYIAVDYDYEYMRFFTNENRVGKTYLLDRDFTFYFSAEQHVIEQSSSSSESQEQGGGE